MNVGDSVTVQTGGFFIEGKILLIAVNSEKKVIFKVESTDLTEGPAWLPSDDVYQILS